MTSSAALIATAASPALPCDAVVPEAVVVDTTDGYTWSRDLRGSVFTLESATRFALERNAAMREHGNVYVVFRLVVA